MNIETSLEEERLKKIEEDFKKAEESGEIDAIFEELKKRDIKQEECGKQGHRGERVLSASYFRSHLEMRCYCDECGASYSRYPTQEERRDFNKRMSTPMTI